MLLRNKRILFVHIPKTGGQSVSKFFYKNLGYTWNPKDKDNEDLLFLKNYKRELPGPEVLVHMTAQEYVDLGYISKEDFNNYFKFSIVRNPYSRFISAYKFNKVYEKYEPEKFIENMPTDEYSDLYRHFMPQSNYIFKNQELLVDKILYQERLNLDFTNYIIRPYNFKNTLDVTNKTKKVKKKIELSSKLIKFINIFYDKDFKNLGYQKYEGS